MIKLKKNIIILDIEATGLDVVNDRIVEIGIIKISTDGKKSEFHKRINPEKKIPLEISKIHGIYNKDIENEPTFKDIVPELEKFIEKSDIVGYNSNKFDLPILAEELIRANSIIDLSNSKHIDVQNIFHKMEERTLVAAYNFYCNKKLENAHSAIADANATYEILNAQISRYDEIKNDVNFLANFSNYENVTRIDFAGRLAINKEGIEIYNFGKHKGKSIKEISISEPSYYGWIMEAEFPRHTKQCLKKIIKKIKKEKEKEKFNIKLKNLKNKFK
tara:strand:- start:64692 stop:65516 length:825 start_codon:yes stop_codon:yes gene_type:complete